MQRPIMLGMATAKGRCTTSSPDRNQTSASAKVISFWERLLSEEELQDCASLEKLLVGCELIAALDGIELLAA